MVERIQIKVIGKVQGVFFRKFTQITANKLGVKGFVKNEPDGSVFIDAEGDKQSLINFLSWCAHGPEHAVVKEIVNENMTSLKYYAEFKIN